MYTIHWCKIVEHDSSVTQELNIIFSFRIRTKNIFIIELWCGCGASYPCAPVSPNYPLFSNVMIKFILIDGAAA